MGSSFALISSCNKGPFDNQPLEDQEDLREYFWMTFDCHNFSYNQPLSNRSLLA